jgi:hypothetical protein
VTKKGHYVVTLDVVKQWKDGSLAASPLGLKASDYRLGLGYLGVPLRRVVDAAYLQPIVEIRPAGVGGWFGKAVRIDMLNVSNQGDSPNLYRGEFEASKDGELFVFVNDAMLPPLPSSILPDYDYSYFYKKSGGPSEDERGNHGTACLTVEAAEVAGEPMGPPPPLSACADAAARTAESAKSASGAAPPVAAYGKKAAASGHAAAKK